MIKSLNGFNKGDLVYCNPDKCYVCYSQFIKRHPKYMLKWAYRTFPKDDMEYVIDGFYKHVMKENYDNDSYVVVVKHKNNGQTFLIGESGLSRL